MIRGDIDMILRIKKIHAFIFIFCVLMICTIIGISTQAISISKSVTERCTPLPVIMYHQISTKSGRTGKFVITVQQLESDFKHIKQAGYEAITMKDLLNHIENGASLPKKPIMITFDDGYETFYTIVLPLLQKYDLKAIVSVIGSATEKFSLKDDHNTSYSHLNWNEIAELVDCKYAEIQNHTFDLHTKAHGRKGVARKPGESFDDYKEEIINDLGRLQDAMIENTGYAPTAFAYPFGTCPSSCVSILKQLGIKAAFNCVAKINYIDTKNTNWLYDINRFNRPSGVTGKDFFSKMLK